jgi:hypothetical protein
MSLYADIVVTFLLQFLETLKRCSQPFCDIGVRFSFTPNQSKINPLEASQWKLIRIAHSNLSIALNSLLGLTKGPIVSLLGCGKQSAAWYTTMP